MKLEVVFKDGRKETFDSVVGFNVTEEQTANEECHTPEVAQPPSEGELFEVNPLGIDRSNFKKLMKDERQERTRQIIQEAFAEVDKKPEKYALPFYTLIPKETLVGDKTVRDLMIYAIDLGGLMADWVEQALEWAQRIANGESWECICNNDDTAKWYRLVVWKDGKARLVGGSVNTSNRFPSSDVSDKVYFNFSYVYGSVPLVVLKKK